MKREGSTYFVTRIQEDGLAESEQVLLRPDGSTFRSVIKKGETVDTSIERGRTYQDNSSTHVIVGSRRIRR